MLDRLQAALVVALLCGRVARGSHHAPLCTPSEPLDKACADCVVRVFVDAHLKYEMKWVIQFLLGGFLDACGKHTQMRWRHDFLKAHQCPGLPTVLVAMHGMQARLVPLHFCVPQAHACPASDPENREEGFY